MPHPYAGSGQPQVHDLARAQQQGWLSFNPQARDSQYTPQRQQQFLRRPLDVPRRKGRATQKR